MKKFLLTCCFLLVANTSLAEIANVECIAPAGVGGGWDFTCRVPAAQVMPKLGLVKGSIEVTNMSGAGGGKAFAHVVTKRKGDEKLIVAASMATAARLGQNVYAGFNADNVRWLGALGADYGVIAVKTGSKYKNIKQLLSDVKKGKNIRIVGASSAGGWDHLKFLILANKYGIKNLRKINYVAFDNGGKAMLEVISGRAEIFTGDTSEILSNFDAGKIRVLAVLAPKRIKRLGKSKTAREQGFDVIGANWRGFYAPAGISNVAYKRWVKIITKVAKSKEWRELRDKNGLAPFESFGGNFEKFIKGQVKIVRNISKDLGFMK